MNRMAAALTVMSLSGVLMADPALPDFLADLTQYGVPAHGYNGYDQEKFSVSRLYEEEPRIKARIALDYSPGRGVKILEGWYCADSYVNAKGNYQTSFLPAFKNLYDPQGRITEKTQYSVNGPLVVVVGYYRYDYESHGRLSRYREWDGDGRYYRQRLYKYDASGRLVDADLYPGEGSNQYFSYDAQGRLLEKKVLQDGRACLEYKAEYRGQALIRQTYYHPGDGEAYSRDSYSYGTAGQLLEETHSEGSPLSVRQRISYRYDAQQRRLESSLFEASGSEAPSLSQKTVYGYQGQACVSQRDYGPDGALIRSTARVFDSAGRLTREELSYPDSGYSGPSRRYEARYKDGLLVEEQIWTWDDYANKLQMAERLAFSWTKAKLSGRDYFYRNAQGQMYQVESHRFLYDAKGQLFRDEYWQYHDEDHKLHLDQASIYRYDGVQETGSNPQRLPILGNALEYKPE